MLLSFAGLIMGALSLKRIKARPEELGGRGLAIGGVITSLISLLINLAAIVIGILMLTVFAGAIGSEMMQSGGYY